MLLNKYYQFAIWADEDLVVSRGFRSPSRDVIYELFNQGLNSTGKKSWRSKQHLFEGERKPRDSLPAIKAHLSFSETMAGRGRMVVRRLRRRRRRRRRRRLTFDNRTRFPSSVHPTVHRHYETELYEEEEEEEEEKEKDLASSFL